MDLTGTYTFNAPVSTVWSLLNDPDVIASCLPGCDKLEPLGDDRYRASLSVAVAAIGGRYNGTVALLDKDAPRGYRMMVDGSGGTGFVKGEARISFAETEGATTVSVIGSAQVGGLIARVGQRLLGSVSQMMMDRFFDCLRQKAEARV